MRTIHLYGPLRKKYGEKFRFEVSSVAEAVRALETNFRGFAKDIEQGSWHITVGESKMKGASIGEEDIVGFNVGGRDIHIFPELTGRKNNGLLKVVVGVALIGISFGFAGTAFMTSAVAPALMGTTTWGTLIGMTGVSLALAGASMLLAPQQEDQKDNSSSMIAPPASNVTEGSIVQIAYGRAMVTPQIIGSIFDTELVDL